jgi:hypothetical protein
MKQIFNVIDYGGSLIGTWKTYEEAETEMEAMEESGCFIGLYIDIDEIGTTDDAYQETMQQEEIDQQRRDAELY